SDEEYLNILRPLLKKKEKELKAQRSRLNAKNSMVTQKLLRFAVGRGFTYDIIRQCIDSEDDD
nr:RecX family transcriptional regulator [Prevotella sp.]